MATASTSPGSSSGRCGPGRSGTIKGLYVAGAGNSWGPGVEGAMAAGLGAASTVLRRDLFGEVRKGRVFGDTAALPAIGPDWDPLMEVGGPENQRHRAEHRGSAAMTQEPEWSKTACILCENDCGIHIQLDERRFAKIRGHPRPQTSRISR